MMRDRVYHWASGRVRKDIRFRYWWGGWRSIGRFLLAMLSGRPYSGTLTFDHFARDGENGRCYCCNGRTMQIGASFFGVAFRLWFHRHWMPLPCQCDKVVWLLYPSEYADEIEEYGRDRLEAELSGVKPIE